MASHEHDRIYNVWPPGHYYSPIPDINEVKSHEAQIYLRPDHFGGIDLNLQGQLELFDSLKEYYGELPFRDQKYGDLRYYYKNDYFSYGDGIILYSMVRHLKPKKIIEVGSGFSSCVLLDTNEKFFNNSISCTFIEPYPDRLLSLIRKNDLGHVGLLRKNLEDVDKTIFSSLSSGDILFIDSSHVSKMNSDVNRIIFEILPILKPGVFIHIHDIFYPFEYPKEWIYEGRFWNEAYLLRAFLEFNSAFRIMFFSSYLFEKCGDAIVKGMPLYGNCPGASFWMKKISHPR